MATQRLQVYKCLVCGNIAEILDGGAGELVCCGQPMQLQEEKTADKTKEKHVPFVEKTPAGVKVTVGQAALHPMEPKHFIEWIEVLADGKVYRRFLKPGDPPSAVFEIQADKVTAREYCNIHGLWKG